MQIIKFKQLMSLALFICDFQGGPHNRIQAKIIGICILWFVLHDSKPLSLPQWWGWGMGPWWIQQRCPDSVWSCVFQTMHTLTRPNSHQNLRNVMYSCSSSFSGIFPAVNISRTVCLIGLCKVSKEAAQWAGFNGAHHFGVKCPSGGENWNQKNYLTNFSVFWKTE